MATRTDGLLGGHVCVCLLVPRQALWRLTLVPGAAITVRGKMANQNSAEIPLKRPEATTSSWTGRGKGHWIARRRTEYQGGMSAVATRNVF